MGIEFDRGSGALAGGTVGLAGGVALGRRLAETTAVDDIVSTSGSLAGASQSRLPQVPSFFSALAARRTAREFIASNPQLNALSTPAKSVLVDGIATRVGASLADPNSALDVLDSAASFAARKLAPAHHAEITGALSTIREQGVRTVNATVGANTARYLSRIAIPTVAGIALAGVGALVGASMLPKVDGASMPDVSMPDVSNPFADRVRSAEKHDDDYPSNDAMVGEIVGQTRDQWNDWSPVRVHSSHPKEFENKSEAVKYVTDHFKFGHDAALVHRSLDDYEKWSISRVTGASSTIKEFNELDRTGEKLVTDSLLMPSMDELISTTP